MKTTAIKNNSFKKIGKTLFFTLAAILLIIAVINLVWTMSGSNKWELEIDKDGVQVYSYKESGTYGKQVKAVTHAHYSLSQIAAAFLMDNDSLDNCKNWIPTCVGDVVLEPYSSNEQGDTVLWTLELLPPIFSNREYLIKTRAAQDKQTKVVSVDIMAAANKLPLHDCCVRITHIHNRWQITPLVNDEVEIQLVQDFDMGGFFPHVLINLGVAQQTWKLFHDQLPVLLNNEKYKSAKFDFIEEVNAEGNLADKDITFNQ